MKYTEALAMRKQAADPVWRPRANVVPAANKWQVRPMGGYHVVQKGDTLAGIADRYGVQQQRFAQSNPTADPARLRIGQKLAVPVNEQVWMKATRQFDPEQTYPLNPQWRKALLLQESQDGKFLQNAHSSAKGPYQMLADRFRVTQAAHPEMKNWKHDDLMTDRAKADKAFDFAMQDMQRRFHYLNGRRMTDEEMVRAWHQPNAMHNNLADNYYNAVSRQYKKLQSDTSR